MMVGGIFSLGVRLCRTVGHLRPSQLIRRPINRVKRRVSIPFVRLPKPIREGRLSTVARFELDDPWNSRESIEAGVFQFLNRRADLANPPDWTGGSMPLLWQFNLHYFAYLGLLDADGKKTLVTHWIEKNPRGAHPAWHPYPVSLRIVNWIKWAPGNEGIHVSLYQQAAYLYRNLETDIGGNHLVENARALIFAGLYFREQGEAPKWLRRGLSVLEKELVEQVLPDGGHYERSPMYHAIMLEVCLDVANVTQGGGIELPWLDDAVERMLVFDASVCHPDGRRPLLNDATYEIAPSVEALQGYAQRLGYGSRMTRESLPDTGIYIHRTPHHVLIVDGGEIGPDHLPAHAHADTFGFELSIGGHLFATDTGVYEYQQGDKRSYCRSTAAHNCLTVDGVDQAECWSSFRVARRYKPQDVRVERDGSQFRFSGRFPGYAGLIGDGIQHTRHIEAADSRVHVRDTVDGRGSHLVQSFLHVHPDWKGVQVGEFFRFTREGQDVVVQHNWPDARLAESPWYPEFGKEIMRDCIVFSHEGALPSDYSYQIKY